MLNETQVDSYYTEYYTITETGQAISISERLATADDERY